jgi:hypothetical protein
VKELRPLTPEEFARAQNLLLNPPAGSRMEAAKRFGIDLALLIEQLRLTPEERLRRLERAAKAIEKVRGVARRRS